MVWYKQLKFRSNPLDVRPNIDLVGVEEEEERLVNYILKGDICFLNGLTGSGKTSLLKRVQKKLPSFRFIYLNAEDLPRNFSLKRELMKQRDFFDKIMLKDFPRKKPVLIIDEFQATDPRIVLEAKGKWENPYSQAIRSVVISQISTELANASGSFKDRLGKRIIKLGVLDDELMKEVLKRRLYNKVTGINYYRRLTPEAVDLLVKCADGSVRRLLEYTDTLFDFHYQRFRNKNPLLKSKTYAITYHGAKEILALHGVSVEGFEQKTDIGEERKDAEDVFSQKELKILRFLANSEPKTMKELSRRLRMSEKVVKKLVLKLKRENAIVSAGKSRGVMLWDISNHTKRMLVKE